MRGVAPALGRPGTPGSPPTTSRPPAWSGPSASRSPAARAARAARRPTDELDDSSLREAVARSEALMAAAQPDPEQVEGLGPQDYPDDPRLRRGHRRRRPARAARRRQGGPRPRPRARARRLGLLRERRPLVGDRQQEGELRLPPLDLGRIFDHDAHRRRHRLGLRRVRLPAASRLRPGRARRAGGDQGRVVGEARATCRRASTP